MSENENSEKINVVYHSYDESLSYKFKLEKKYNFLSFRREESSLGQEAIFSNDEKDKDENIIEYYNCILKIEKPYENCARGKLVLKFMTILTQVKHENIIKLKEIYIPVKDNYNAYLILEYIPTSVERLIESNYDYFSNKKIVPFIIYQILMGVFYLHSAGIIHRNLNPSNILLDENTIVKITGLNYAIYKDTYENTLKGETNDFIEEKISLSCLAPEILASKKKSKEDYDEKSDIWSIGCIFASLLLRQPTFFPLVKKNNIKWESQINGIFKKLGKPSKEEIAKFASKERAKDIMKLKHYEKMDKKVLYPNLNDEKAIDLIEKFLRINPKDRITILEAKDHPYFDIIQDWKRNTDFIFKGKPFSYIYKRTIDNMEKKNEPLSKQIEFYKDHINILEGKYNNEPETNYNVNYYNDNESTREQTK